MHIISSYKVKIKNFNHCFDETIRVYQEAVSFFMDVCQNEWESFQVISNHETCFLMEKLTLATKKRPTVKYDFNAHFYKMPCYLRRAAIAEAIGAYSSWFSNHENWKNNPNEKEPQLQLDRNVMPVFYKGNMFKRISEDEAMIKIFFNNDWVWLRISLRRQDVKYILKHCADAKGFSPILEKKGKCCYLRFAFQEEVKLNKTDIQEQKVCAVDLGLNNDAVCSVMDAEGTVIARRFIRQAVEKDHLHTVLNRIRKQQQHGARRCRKLWSIADNINREMCIPVR